MPVHPEAVSAHARRNLNSELNVVDFPGATGFSLRPMASEQHWPGHLPDPTQGKKVSPRNAIRKRQRLRYAYKLQLCPVF